MPEKLTTTLNRSVKVFYVIKVNYLHWHIFSEHVGSLVMIIEELFQGNSGSGLENRN
jgi:hypothetical protein